MDMAITGGLGAITNLAIKEIAKKAKKVAEDVDEETMLQAIKDKVAIFLLIIKCCRV